MVRCKVELWMWLGKELGEDFRSLSRMRSVLETVVEEGTTVGKLFENLAGRHGPIGERVFRNRGFVPYVAVIMNERIVSAGKVCARIVKDGDRIIVLPGYAGG